MKISIIIPAYNCGNFLPLLLRKLDSQIKKENVEIIVVNDGSTDNTEEILKEYKSNSKTNVIVINKENGGVSSARNVGLNVATGEYICFVDSDDDISDKFINKLLEAAEDGKDIYQISWESFGAYGGIYHAKELPGWNCSVWSRFWKADVIKHRFDESLKTCEDAKFLAENIVPGLKIGYINEPIYRYYSGRPGSLCNQKK